MRLRPMVVLATCAAVASSGCSVLLVRGAPSVDDGRRPAPCTESRVIPVVDLVPGLGLAGIGLAIAASGDEDAKSVATLVSIPFFIGAVPFLASSLYGFRKTSRCRSFNRTPPLRPAPIPAPMSPGPPGAGR